MSQITTLTIFKYHTPKSKIWAFWMMQFAHRYLKDVSGCGFYKLMGSGRDGFDPRPDWSVYTLLQVWEEEHFADTFFKESELFSRYREHVQEMAVLYLKNIKAHGKWSGRNPFKKHPELDPDNPQVAVLTRATIKKRFLRRFWSYVPTSKKPLEKSKGLLYAKGIGEWPVLQMATFSIWDTTDHLKAYAYESSEHKNAIAHTRQLGWYKEELFSRFQPYRMEGHLSEMPHLFANNETE